MYKKYLVLGVISILCGFLLGSDWQKFYNYTVLKNDKSLNISTFKKHSYNVLPADSPCNLIQPKEYTFVAKLDTQVLDIYQLLEYNSEFECKFINKLAITSGKHSSPTPAGMYLLNKPDKIFFNKKLHNWVTFERREDNFLGIHEASWQENEDFGDYEYSQKFGSSACIRIPFGAFEDIKPFITDTTLLQII